MTQCIKVGRGWKESEHPGELYVAQLWRWDWCPLNEVAKIVYADAVKTIRKRGKR